MNYLLIAYKPDSADYCRNCLMASYDSNHSVETNLTREELIKSLAEYYYKNMNLRCNEAGYGFWVFTNGVQIMSDSSISCDFGHNLPGNEYSERYAEIEETQAKFEIDMSDIKNQAEILAKTRETDAKRLKAEADLKKRQEEAAKLLVQKEQQYEALRKELNKG